MTRTRRKVLLGLSAFSVSAILALPSHAQSLADLAKTAASGEPVVWYESSPENQIDKVLEAFAKDYPDIKVRHVRITGGNALATRAVQETQARGYTADLLTGGADHIWQLNDRQILLQADYGKLGIDQNLRPNNFAVATAASVYVALWNTDKVKESDVPASWDDVNDPKWAGKMGSWVRAAAWAQLAHPWGKEKAEAMLRKHVELKPFLFKSTFPLAQQVAAGEVDVAIGFYHSSQPPIQKGAPIKLKALNPAPMHTIYSAVGKDGKNAAGAQVLLAWLSTLKGNKAYEAGTSRGSPLIAGTETAALLKGISAAEWPPEKTAEYSVISEEFNKILSAVGQAK